MDISINIDIPGTKNTIPAECIIRINDESIEDLYPFLVEVNVDIGRGEAAEASLVFETRRDSDGTWTIQDDDRLETWAPFVISAAFAEHEEEIVRGYIRQIKVDYPQDGASTTVTITGQDDSLPMDREHVPCTWGDPTPVTDGYIVDEIISGYSHITLDPGSGAGISDLCIQQSQRDSQFMRVRADVNGYELIFSEGYLYFGPMRLDMKPQDTIMVYAGPSTNCIGFSIDEDGQLPDKVIFEIAGRNGATNIREDIGPDVTVLGNAPSNSENMGLQDFSWRLEGQGGQSENEVRAMAQAKANKNAFKIKATGQLDGSLYGHVLRVAEPVGVDGVGEKYGGIYYVDRVTHSFDSGGYTQSFTLIRNAYGDNLEVSSSLIGGLL